MTNCTGLLGKIFGHKFKSYIVKSRYKLPSCDQYNIDGSESISKFIDAQRNIYKVICKRCGEEK